MSAVSVLHDRGRRGVLLQSDSPAEIQALVRDRLGGPRTRRAGGHLLLDFEQAVPLLDVDDTYVNWDPAARRAVEQRARIRENAPTVQSRVRALRAGGAAAARAALGSGWWAERLDDHQLTNAAI